MESFFRQFLGSFEKRGFFKKRLRLYREANYNLLIKKGRNGVCINRPLFFCLSLEHHHAFVFGRCTEIPSFVCRSSALFADKFCITWKLCCQFKLSIINYFTHMLIVTRIWTTFFDCHRVASSFPKLGYCLNGTIIKIFDYVNIFYS